MTERRTCFTCVNCEDRGQEEITNSYCDLHDTEVSLDSSCPEHETIEEK